MKNKSLRRYKNSSLHYSNKKIIADLEQVVSDFIDLARERIQIILQIIASNLNENGNNNLILAKIWQQSLVTNQRLGQVVQQSLDFSNRQCMPQSLFASFNAAVEEHDKYQVQGCYFLDMNLCARQITDGVWLRIKKWFMRRNQDSRRLVFRFCAKIKNFLARLFLIKKQKRQKNKTNQSASKKIFFATRNVKVHRFLFIYWLRPILTLQLTIQRKALEGIYAILAQFSETLNAYNDSLILDKQAWLDLIAESADQREKHANATLALITAIVEKLPRKIDLLEKNLRGIIRKQMKDINEQVQVNWITQGTILTPLFFCAALRMKKTKRQTQKIIKTNAVFFRHKFLALSFEMQKDADITRLQLLLSLSLHKTLTEVSKSINDHILPKVNDLRQPLAEATLAITDEASSNDADKTSLIIRSQLNLITTQIRHQKLPLLLNHINMADIGEDLEQLANRVKGELDKFAASHKVAAGLEKAQKTKDIEIDEIAFRELIIGKPYAYFAREIKARIPEFTSLQSSIKRNVTELDQLIEYNLDSAVTASMLQNELKKDQQSPLTIAKEGLERANSHISLIVNAYQKMCEDTILFLSSIASQYQQEILFLRDTEKMFHLKWRLGRSRTLHSLARRKARFHKYLHDFLAKTKKQWMTAKQRISSGFFRLKKISGLEDGFIESPASIGQYLHSYQIRYEKLPFVYQRLFQEGDNGFLKFFQGRGQEQDRMKNLLNHWRSGLPTVIIINGETGCGKSMLISFILQNMLQDEDLIRIKLTENIHSSHDFYNRYIIPEINSKDDIWSKIEGQSPKDKVAKYLVSISEPKVIVLENIQYLFLRHIDGFSLLEDLRQTVLNTSQKVLWVISSALYAWNYLDKVLKLGSMATEVLELTKMSQQHLEETLLSRHRMSGYQFKFEPTEQIKRGKRYGKIKNDVEKQLFLRERFFQDISEYSQGNVRIAIMLWLNAIKSIGSDTMIISMEQQFDFLHIFRLPFEDHAVLTAIIIHEALNAAQLAIVFKQNTEASYRQLEKLKSAGLLKYERDLYSIEPMFYRPVVRALKMKKLL